MSHGDDLSIIRGELIERAYIAESLRASVNAREAIGKGTTALAAQILEDLEYELQAQERYARLCQVSARQAHAVVDFFVCAEKEFRRAEAAGEPFTIAPDLLGPFQTALARWRDE